MKINRLTPKTPEKEKKERKKSSRLSRFSGKQSQSISQIMNGEFLNRDFVINNLNYILFVFFLLILVVSKGYYVRQLANDIHKEETEVNNITADLVETKARLEEETTRTKLVERLRPLGLKETVNPTKVIRVKEDKE